MGKMHLRNYLVLIITGLAVGATVLIAGVLFFSLRQNLINEFNDRVQAEGRQAGLELESFLARTRNRLKELSLDNTVRVTLMLGVDQQLQEHLTRTYRTDSGPHFYVCGEKDKKIFSADGTSFDRKVVAPLLAAAPYLAGIQQDLKGRFRAAYSLPIYRKSEKIGSAAVLFYFHDDEKLVKELGPETNKGQLVFQGGNRFWDLITGQTMKVDESDINPLDIRSFSKLIVAGNEVMAVPLGPNFRGLLYFASTKTLKDSQLHILWLISVLAAGVALLAALISVLLSRKLAKPLNDLSGWAREVAKGNSAIQDNSNAGSNILEVDQLRASLSTMLDNLNKAEEFKRYQVLFDGVSDAVFIHTVGGTILEANQVALNMFGLQKEQLGKCKAQQLVPQSQIQLLNNSRRQLIEQQNQAVFEIDTITPGGNIIPTEIHARKICYRDQEVILSVVRDISDRKRAEYDLRQSERKYRTTFQAIPDSITISDLETGVYLEVNEGFTQISGYDREEVIGKSVLELKLFKNPDDRAKLVEGIKQFGRVQELELPYIDKQGKVLDIAVTAKPIEYGGRKCILSVGRDITSFKAAEAQRKQLQSELQHAKKMQAIGTLAGGVAHDFNNVLQVISGYVELMKIYTDTSDTQAKHLKQIMSSVDRARDLVRQLLTFSRKVEPVLKPLDINQEVSLAVGLLERMIPKMINIEFHPGHDLRLVNGDATQLEQVLLNLGANARDAMPSGGKLFIHTGNITIGANHEQARLDLAPGEYVLLTVKDTGRGIQEESLEHIFEPFFTTKDVGRGTGLGLATVFGIVESHKGKILCKSKLNHGTAFEIFLPALKAEQPEIYLLAPKTEPVSLEGKGTILLVDDEQALTDAAAEFMKQYGFTVLTGSSGEEALDVFNSNRESVDLVIMDLGMPGMGGKACLQELLKINPHLNVIIASGYADPAVEHDVTALGACSFVRKPYQFKDILTKVHQFIN
jgi:PAS domain S-box-containing protein